MSAPPRTSPQNRSYEYGKQYALAAAGSFEDQSLEHIEHVVAGAVVGLLHFLERTTSPLLVAEMLYDLADQQAARVGPEAIAKITKPTRPSGASG